MVTVPAEIPPRLRSLWVLAAAAALVVGVLGALQTYLQARLGGGGPVPWKDVLFSASDWLLLAVVTPIALLLARQYPLRREALGRAAAAHLAGALALCLAWAGLGVLLGVVLHHYPVVEDRGLGQSYLSWSLTTLPFSALVYFGVLGSAYALTYFLEARRRQAEEARLEAQLAEARLGALRMQLNPHFLFNSLNAVSVLVRDRRNEDAARVIELLSGVLREVLQGEKRADLPLAEEVRFLEQYLAIEQIRFSDRLSVRWSIDPHLRAALVPAFILQPLVENAVRHGAAARSEPGTIEIAANLDGDDVVLTVRDGGPGYDPAAAGTGVGLANVRERLATSFGPAASLEVTPAAGGGTVATIRLPLRRADA